jgi:hypothetical protein
MTFIAQILASSILAERAIGSIIAGVIIVLLLVLDLVSITPLRRRIIIGLCAFLFIVFLGLVAAVQRSIQ